MQLPVWIESGMINMKAIKLLKLKSIYKFENMVNFITYTINVKQFDK